MSADPKCAMNAGSFGQDDGSGFIGEEPSSPRTVKASLRFPIDRFLADGVLFTPRSMEHKWALFYHQGEIICVRSWQRQVHVVAHVEQRGDYVEITRVRGTFVSEEEEPEFTIRILDYLLRSHALDLAYPAPVPAELESDPYRAAMWCFAMFGDRTIAATPFRFDSVDPGKPLRTRSLLHFGVARCNTSEIEKQLAAGVPIDLLDGDGFAPLHLAVAMKQVPMIDLLLARGSPVGVRSAGEGGTPLMLAVQGSPEITQLLMERGADVNARNNRGFTPLHVAADAGHLDIVKLLLDRGATPNPEAEGHTPRSTAEQRQRPDIVAVIDKYIASAN